MADAKHAFIVGLLPSGSKLDATLGAVTRVGAASDGDVVVPVHGVSRQHARIVRSGDDYVVEDAGSRFGTWVNGRRITRATLRHLDVITLGSEMEVVFLAARERTRPAIDPRASVAADWIEGAGKGATFPVQPGAALVIGRGAQCAISIDDAAVSRAHARISFSDGRLQVEDLGSANGTFVSGQRLSAPAELQDRDEIDVAHVAILRIRISVPEPVKVAAIEPASAEERAIAAAGVDWQTRMMGPVDVAALHAPVPPTIAPTGPPAGATVRQAAAPLRPPALPVEQTPASPVPTPEPAAPTPPAPPAPAAGAAGSTVLAGGFSAPRMPGGLPPGLVSFHEAGGPIPEGTDSATLAMPAQPAANTVTGVRLTGTAGTFTLGTGRSTIGRAPEATVHIPSRTISRIHVAITVRGDQAVVEDAGSANGTSVNDQRIEGPRVLADGDRIAAADIMFTVTLLRGV